jgi:hypothetical protein
VAAALQLAAIEFGEVKPRGISGTELPLARAPFVLNIGEDLAERLDSPKQEEIATSSRNSL